MNNELTLVGHLAELRQRILVSAFLVLLLSVLAFGHVSEIFAILKLPAAGLIDKLVFFSPTEAFSAYLKVSVFTALALGSPVLLYQLWAFISPGLDETVRREGTFFLTFTVSAFFAGIMFGYFFLLPAALKFLIGFSSGVLQPLISVSEYISFVLGVLFGCGLVFEMPVLSYIMARIGVLDHRLLRRSWKYAVLVIFIVAAIITPTPDAFNMCLMALPMLGLYEISIWVAKWSAPARLKA